MITLPEAQLLFTVVNAFYLSRFYSLLLTRCFLATFLIFSHFRLYFWMYMHLHANTPPGRPFLFYCELISEPLCASRTGVHALQSIIRSRSINKCISSLSFARPLSLSLSASPSLHLFAFLSPFLSISISLSRLLASSLARSNPLLFSSTATVSSCFSCPLRAEIRVQPRVHARIVLTQTDSTHATHVRMHARTHACSLTRGGK